MGGEEENVRAPLHTLVLNVRVLECKQYLEMTRCRSIQDDVPALSSLILNSAKGERDHVIHVWHV